MQRSSRTGRMWLFLCWITASEFSVWALVLLLNCADFFVLGFLINANSAGNYGIFDQRQKLFTFFLVSLKAKLLDLRCTGCRETLETLAVTALEVTHLELSSSFEFPSQSRYGGRAREEFPLLITLWPSTPPRASLATPSSNQSTKRFLLWFCFFLPFFFKHDSSPLSLPMLTEETGSIFTKVQKESHFWSRFILEQLLGSKIGCDTDDVECFKNCTGDCLQTVLETQNSGLFFSFVRPRIYLFIRGRTAHFSSVCDFSSRSSYGWSWSRTLRRNFRTFTWTGFAVDQISCSVFILSISSENRRWSEHCVFGVRERFCDVCESGLHWW